MDLKDLIIRVITSWQVIAVTVALVLYFTLVSYVARFYHEPRAISLDSSPAPKKGKGGSPAAEVPEASADEELGLEEE